MERIRVAVDMARHRQLLPARPRGWAPSGKGWNDGRVPYTRTVRFVLDEEFVRERRVVPGTDDDAATNSYRMLRTQVLRKLKENGWNVLAVTSPRRGAGKSLTALNLAFSLAQDMNQTVLLVDADLREPAIHRYLGYEPALGLSDYLRDRVPLERLLVNPNVERLVVLPGRESVANSSEMLASARMRDLVQELKRRYADRVVVFDVPALLDSDDALAFSPNVDALLLVVREGRTRKADVTRAVSVIEGVPLLGTVLNDASEPWGRER